eukprot:8442036-Heterocapsa_arctica.AAC.1
MGASLRPANAEELLNYSPSLDTDRRDNIIDLALSSQVSLPLPVHVKHNLHVEPMDLKFGVYDRVCLKMRLDASGKYYYPTLVDHSVINDFLSGEHGKLATWRK